MDARIFTVTHRRKKWMVERRNLKLGDIMLVVDTSSLPRGHCRCDAFLKSTWRRRYSSALSASSVCCWRRNLRIRSLLPFKCLVFARKTEGGMMPIGVLSNSLSPLLPSCVFLSNSVFSFSPLVHPFICLTPSSTRPRARFQEEVGVGDKRP